MAGRVIEIRLSRPDAQPAPAAGPARAGPAVERPRLGADAAAARRRCGTARGRSRRRTAACQRCATGPTGCASCGCVGLPGRGCGAAVQRRRGRPAARRPDRTLPAGALAGHLARDDPARSGDRAVRACRSRASGDFLAAPENREAIAMAIDRDGADRARSGWPAGPPSTRIVSPAVEGDLGTIGERWADRSLDERRAEAAGRVARWRARTRRSAPQLAIALPRGPGADLLFARLRDDLAAIGHRSCAGRRERSRPTCGWSMLVARYPRADLVPQPAVLRRAARAVQRQRRPARRRSARRARRPPRAPPCSPRPKPS